VWGQSPHAGAAPHFLDFISLEKAVAKVESKRFTLKFLKLPDYKLNLFLDKMLSHSPTRVTRRKNMAFYITTDTANISKVEFKSNPDRSNLAVGWNGNTLLITDVPSGIGAALATLAGFGGIGLPAKELYIEIDRNPATFPSGRGTYLEACYAGRIEIRNPIGVEREVLAGR
jgi:hypothetical protein